MLLPSGISPSISWLLKIYSSNTHSTNSIFQNHIQLSGHLWSHFPFCLSLRLIYLKCLHVVWEDSGNKNKYLDCCHSNQKYNLIMCKLGESPDSGPLILSNSNFSILHKGSYSISLFVFYLFVYLSLPVKAPLQLNSFNFLPSTSFLSRPGGIKLILLLRKIPLFCTMIHSLGILYF